MEVIDEVKKRMMYVDGIWSCESCMHCWHVEKTGGIDVYECRLNPAVHFDIENPTNSFCNHYQKGQKT